MVFQPAFHQALRRSIDTEGRATVRLRFPLGRGGDRVRVTFRSGDGPLELFGADIRRLGDAGPEPSVPLHFGGAVGFVAGARERVTSDPAELSVGTGDWVEVTFEVDGALSASTVFNFPGSRAARGSHLDEPGDFGKEHPRAVGVATVETEGPERPAVVAIGDSITEGYTGGHATSGTTLEDGFLPARDAYERGWTVVTERLLGLPVANAGVSGQGLWDLEAHLEQEVLALTGVTDCVVLMGTNDLGREAEAITGKLDALTRRLLPHCRVWLGTLLPKERSGSQSLEVMQQKRAAVNAWIRGEGRALAHGVIDFEAVMRASDEDVHHFRPGFHEDGIHPTALGYQAMGQQAARVLGERLLP